MEPPVDLDHCNQYIDPKDFSIPPAASIGILDLSGQPEMVLSPAIHSQLDTLPVKLSLGPELSNLNKVPSAIPLDIAGDLNFCSYPNTTPVPDTQHSVLQIETPMDNHWDSKSEISSIFQNNSMSVEISRFDLSKLDPVAEIDRNADNPAKNLNSTSIDSDHEGYSNAIKLCYSPGASQWNELEIDVSDDSLGSQVNDCAIEPSETVENHKSLKDKPVNLDQLDVLNFNQQKRSTTLPQRIEPREDRQIKGDETCPSRIY